MNYTEELPDHIVYSPKVIEFVTVVAECCVFLERASELSKKEFIIQSVKLFSLLYFKTVILEGAESVFEENPQLFVTEEDYFFVREQIENLLGADDSYLEVFHPDMAYSDTPIAGFISENIADVYQELKDFASNYQIGETDIMNDALVYCLETFSEHWGRKLLSALKALHALRYRDDFESETEDAAESEAPKIDRNKFFDYLNEE